MTRIRLLLAAVLAVSLVGGVAPAMAQGPATWCGDLISVDQRNPHRLSNAPMIRVVLVHASDVPAPTQTDFDEVQRAVNVAREFVASQSDGLKTIRFDMNTRCGPQYVSLSVLRLDQPASAVYNDSAMTTVARSVLGRVNSADPYSRPILLVRGVEGGPTHSAFDPSGAGGLGEVADDPQPGVGNRSNDPSRGAVWVQSRVENPDATPGAYLVIHEIFHTLGAVQRNAPHVHNGAHCFDGPDIMCTAATNEGGPCSAVKPSGPLDCNRDDYFSPSPAAGTYLSTNWNTYNSVFLCSTPTCLAVATPPTIAVNAGRTTVPTGEAAILTASGAEQYVWSANGASQVTYGAGTFSGQTVSIPVTWSGPRTIAVRGFSASGTWSDTSIVVTGVGPASGPGTSPGTNPGGGTTKPLTPQAKMTATVRSIKLATFLRSGLLVNVSYTGSRNRLTAVVTSSTRRKLRLSSRQILAGPRLSTTSKLAQRSVRLKPSKALSRKLRRARASFTVTLTGIRGARPTTVKIVVPRTSRR